MMDSFMIVNLRSCVRIGHFLFKIDLFLSIPYYTLFSENSFVKREEEECLHSLSRAQKESEFSKIYLLGPRSSTYLAREDILTWPMKYILSEIAVVL